MHRLLLAPSILLASLCSVSLGIAQPCVVPNNGTGTVDLPPSGCGYVSPSDLHVMIDGLPPGTQINVDPVHDKFFNVNRAPGGNLGGEIEEFDSILTLQMTGEGDLGGFSRTLFMQVHCEVHTGPRTSGDPVQTFPTEMVSLEGSIFGDPDFDTLTIQGGSSFGLPSPGLTRLDLLPGNQFNVDSLFDIEYRIEFQGAPVSVLEGMSGSTTATVGMQAGVPSAGCPPIPAGSDAFPSTGKLVVKPLNDATEPFVLRLSSAHEPDSIVLRQQQTGDTIDVELVQLELTGVHPVLGQVRVHESPSDSSLGRLTNVVQDPATCELVSADSFFDVIVDIELVDLGQLWQPDRPLHIERRIRGLPPKDEPYENPFLDPVTLVNAANGAPEAQLLYHLHHADPPFPSPGQDCFDTVLFAQLNLPGLGFSGDVSLQGPVTVARGPQQDADCAADPSVPCGSDADCVDAGLPPPCLQQRIQTELVEMQLQGFDPLLGPLELHARPSPPSAGQAVSQQPDRTYPADSFFDVFFDISSPAVGQLHNDQPVPVAAIGSSGLDGIRNLPPDAGTVFQSPPSLPIPLLADDGSPVGQIVNVGHGIGTPRDWAPPPPAEDYCFDSWIHLRITIFNPFCEEDMMLGGHFRILRDDPTLLPTGQEFLDALMAKARFDGSSSCVGALTVGLNPGESSEGRISSLAPAEFFPADSFFDVFPVLDTGIGPLHTQAPTHMTTTINTLPPLDEIYFGPGTVIQLFDESGLLIGEIEEVSHEVHEQIFCPADFRSIIRFPNKNLLDVSIPGGGGGVTYDVFSGPLSGVSSFVGSLLVSAAPPLVPAPPSTQSLYFLARARFGAWADTWSSLGLAEQCCRDAVLP